MGNGIMPGILMTSPFRWRLLHSQFPFSLIRILSGRGRKGFLPAIIRRFLGDGDIMRMAFFYTRVADLYKLCVL
jgi:hypothetical protein